MSQEIRELIQAVATKHQVLVKPEDPLMIMHTLNAKLTEHNLAAHEKLLIKYQHSLDAKTAEWEAAALNKAERIINNGLRNCQDHLAKLEREAIERADRHLTQATESLLKRMQYFSYFILGAAGLTLLAVFIFGLLTL